MPGTVIKTKFSTVTATPASDVLSIGEQAYSFLPGGTGDRLYIGQLISGHVEAVQIGGKYYTDIVNAATSANTASTLVKRDASGNFSAGTITGSLTGNASTATAWATPRTFSFTGDATGSLASVDGTAAVSAALTLATVNGNVGAFGSTTSIPVITVNAKGLITSVTTASITTTLGISGDTGTSSVALATDTLVFVGGTGLDSVVTSGATTDTVTFNIDSTVATLTGTQTLTNKTLTSPTINTSVLTGSTNLAVFNTTATTVSAFGASTATSIGAATGTTTIGNDLTVTGDIKVGGNDILAADGTTAITLVNSTGNVTIAGDLKIGGNDILASDGSTAITMSGNNVTISGNLTVSGSTTTVNSSTLTVTDPLVFVANNNSTTDAIDIGLFGLYDSSGTQDQYSGLYRDATDGKWKLFKDLQVAPTTTVNTAGTGYAVATLVADIESTNSTITGGSVTNVTLSSSNATITGGSVTGITDIVVADGGTGVSTFTSNGILYGNGTGAVQVTAAANAGTGNSGYFLSSNAGTPAWTNVIDGGTF